MQPAQTCTSEPPRRLSLKEAAATLNLTESGVRARFRRGELAGERDNSGKIWVYIEPSVKVAKIPQSEGLRGVVDVLKEQMAALTTERDQLRDRLAEAIQLKADDAIRLHSEIAATAVQLEATKAERDDLRRRLNEEAAERRDLSRQLTALLADQRRSGFALLRLWPFRRSETERSDRAESL